MSSGVRRTGAVPVDNGPGCDDATPPKLYASLVLVMLVTQAMWSESSVPGQQAYSIPNAITCTGCQLRLEELITIGDERGPGSFGSIATMVKMRDGRYAIVDGSADYEIAVFAPDGRFTRKVGRRGQGPGEFQWIHTLTASDEGLHAFDAGLRRQTVFSPEFDVIRTISYRGNLYGGAAIVGDSITMLNAIINSPGQIGFLLQAFDRAGELVASIAENPGGFRFDTSDEAYFRALHAGPSGGVWAASRTSYRINRWTLDGNRAESIVREADWFPEHTGGEGAPLPSQPPLPRVLDIREDDLGRLWVLLRVAAEDWADAVVPVTAPAHPEAGQFEIAEFDQAFDSVIEVIDVERHTLIVSTRFDPAFLYILANGEVVSLEDSGEYPRLQLWRISVEPRQPPQEEEYTP